MVASWVGGEVLDHREWKYGRPRRPVIRWSLAGPILALAIAVFEQIWLAARHR